MASRNREDPRYTKPWASRSLRRSRCLLVSTVALVVLALSSALRHLYRGGYITFGRSDPLWSYPYLNASASTFPPHSPTYVVFEPLTSSRRNESLGTVRELQPDCLEASIAAGELCYAGPDPPLDVVWTWVNGSDRLLQDSMVTVRSSHKKLTSTSSLYSQLYRDHDELRHSVRSVLKHFGGHTTQMHIITSDFPIKIPLMDEGKLYNGTRRLGLVPLWLDPERIGKWRHRNVDIGLKYHSEIFLASNASSFNSYGIESQLVNMQGVSENFIYMNDDFFMMADLSASDFYTSTYGTVLRMQPDLLVKNNDNPRASVAGEWAPLEYTNWVLSRRFGSRRRPYTTHAAKSLSMGLMRELSLMWQSELAVTASHPFRGMTEGHRDVYSMFLFSHFVVERWREALLWSWAVGKLGGPDGEWGQAEREMAWWDIGGRPGRRTLTVIATGRITVDEEFVRENLRDAGHGMSGKTKYVFASGDGYPYEYRDAKGALAWPSFPPESAGEFLCTIDYQQCFEQPDASASDFFKTIAFEQNRGCGDCIIHALRVASGVSGLAAFLPDQDRSYTANGLDSEGRTGPVVHEPPHLPLVSDWRQGDFSLRGVITTQGEVNVREWTLRMLQRYRFVIGQTPTVFHQISSTTAARIKLKKVDEDRNVALLCLNDDVQVPSKQADQFLRAWLDQNWGHKAEWER